MGMDVSCTSPAKLWLREATGTGNVCLADRNLSIEILCCVRSFSLFATTCQHSTLKTYGFHLIGHAILGGNLQSHISAGKTIPMWAPWQWIQFWSLCFLLVGGNGRYGSNLSHLMFIPSDVRGWCYNPIIPSKILCLVLSTTSSWFGRLFCRTVGPCLVAISIWMTVHQEIRNGHCSRLLTALVQSRTFKTANHSHLVVGHTHEDVDAVLSLVKRALDAESILLTPRDMMRAIAKKLTPMYEEQGMMFKTIWVETDAWIKL